MQHPNLPHRPPAVDPSGGLRTTQCPQGEVPAAIPLHAQVAAISSPSKFSTEGLSMAAAAHERKYFNRHHSYSPIMKVDDSEELRWPAPRNLSINHTGHDDLKFHMPTLVASCSEIPYQYSQNGMSCADNYNLSYMAQYPGQEFTSQSYEELPSTSIPYTFRTSEAYPPAAYQIEPQKLHESMDLNDQVIDGQLKQLSNDYENYQYGTSYIKSEEKCGYQSPYSDMMAIPTSRDDSPGYPTDNDTCDGQLVDKDLPYAQLIYQALMGAPEKTMILRDIYDWFKKYTDKSLGSETKGWQNSIRHNLSMNGAFEKVNQPCEESRKGFMWRLTEDAIRNGVKSTTRYRSKQPTKRGYRPHHLQPQRQASGAKGGQAARRSARLRRGNGGDNAYRSEPFISRPVPAAFDPGFTHGEESSSYPSSPFYASDLDYGCGSGSSEYGTPHMVPGGDVFPLMPSYLSTPIAHGLPITDTAFMMDQSPTDSLFSNSPSPSTSEPHTPEYQDSWDEDINLGVPCVFEESEYREYAG